MTIIVKRAGKRPNPVGDDAWAFTYDVEKDGKKLASADLKGDAIQQALDYALPGERVEYHTHDLAGHNKVEVIQEEQGSLVEQVIGPDGLLSRTLPGYEPRPQQLEMALLVEQAIAGKDHAVIEAGTGVGKSFAYLLPAVLSGKRVIVSTANLPLQGQLRDKDLPFLQSLSSKKINKNTTFPDFTWAVAKGKSNFACRYKVEYKDKQPTAFKLLPRADMHQWYETTDDGDIEELPYILEPKEREELVVDDNCLRKNCPLYSSCFYYQAKKRWNSANVLVVNHALLALDLMLSSISENATILPKADILIIDEAHQLESYAISAYSAELTQSAVEHGLSGHDELKLPASQLFQEFKAFRLSKETGNARGGQDITIDSTLTFDTGRKLAGDIFAIAQDTWIAGHQADTQEEQEDANTAQRLRNLADKLQAVSIPTMPGNVRHVQGQDTRRGATVTVACNTRWDVAAFLGQLTERYDTVVYTSATLAIGKAGFTMFKSRAGISGLGEASTLTIYTCSECHREYNYKILECECGCPFFGKRTMDNPDMADMSQVLELEVASPFNYADNCLLYLPSKMPEPNDSQYLAACVEQCQALIEASRGRAFVLCTSNYAMNILFENLRDGRYPTKRQGDEPKPALMAWLKSTPGAVLVATKSWWEGIDVQGQALSLVIIDKLPFPVPSDPPFQARCEAWDKANPGKNSFKWLSLPETILQLKQGFGRLIRTTTDRGVVAILDPRLKTKQYGAGVMAALPPAKRTTDIEDIGRFFA